MSRVNESRPEIAVTVSTRSGWRIFPLIAFNVWLGGGRAVRWDAGRPSDLATVKGLIVGGGDDVSPTLYGGAIVPEARIDPERDALEHRLCVSAVERGMPVLGICRGSQMLNIALGGSLHTEAFAAYPGSAHYKTVLPRRPVDIVPGTRLAEIAGVKRLTVNALHTQAVDRLGAQLRVCARDGGGMVQAIERISDPFALGVQWHPEHLFYRGDQRRLFRALVSAARTYQAGGSGDQQQIEAAVEAA